MRSLEPNTAIKSWYQTGAVWPWVNYLTSPSFDSLHWKTAISPLRVCGRQTLRWTPIISTSWYSHAYPHPPNPWMWAEPVTCLQSTGRWWDVISMIVLHKILIPILRGDCHLLGLHTLMKPAVMLGKSMWLRSEDTLWPTVS